MITSIFILKLVFLCVSLIITFGYLTTWVKFQKYQFMERNPEYVSQFPMISKKWHLWKDVNQFIFFFIMSIPFHWEVALIDAVVYWIFFDAWINKILGKGFFYVGTTALTDRVVQHIAEVFQIKASIISIFFKLLLLIFFLSILF